jgi:hypothetical protein
MAAYGNNTVQTLVPNGATTFPTVIVPCNRGFVRYRDGIFVLSGWTPYDENYGCSCCNANDSAIYDVHFKGNIAIPTGGTVEEISLALALNGTVMPLSTMRVTPAVVEQYFNVSVDMPVEIWNGCCQSVSVINTSSQDILVDTPLITFSRPDLVVSY